VENVTAWELVTILVAVASLGMVVALTYTVLKLRQATEDLSEMTREIQKTVESSTGRLERQATEIQKEYHRVDGLIETAEMITSRANFVSGLTYSVFTKPIGQIASLLKGGVRMVKVVGVRLLRSQIKT
jgi:methyl-accepting chemotaxis protein|tara:strand:+ start:463 stop:849 length:387 start_codon:yes stop_codon:yes gene_type:complete